MQALVSHRVAHLGHVIKGTDTVGESPRLDEAALLLYL